MGTPAAVSDLERAILRTLVYSDIFDYPLTRGEIARYLHGCPATPEIVQRALADDPTVSGFVESDADYFCLAGRRSILHMRRERAIDAARVWPRALRYGRWLARLPFVRMVALTGALAVENLSQRRDIDYLIVTEPGRLWSARASAIALVRLVKPAGDVICPNYLVSEHALLLEDRSLFTAHDLTQMIPISGLDVYARLRSVNTWTADYLPNAAGPPRAVDAIASKAGTVRAALERAGRMAVGARFERWEMTRKVRKFATAAASQPEAVFSSEVCKGHLDGHGRRVLSRFAERLNALGLS